MVSFKNFLRNYKHWLIFAVLIVVVGGYFVLPRGGSSKVETAIIERSTVVQKINVSGKVEAAQEVDLAIQSGGQISYISALEGQAVSEGQVILSVNTRDLEIQLGKERAAVEKARLSLTKQEGSSNTGSDLEATYEEATNVLSDAFLDMPEMISEIDLILYDSSHSGYLSSVRLYSIGGSARMDKNAVGYLFDRLDEEFDILIDDYTKFSRDSSRDEIEELLSETYSLLRDLSDIVKDLRDLIQYVEDRLAEPKPSEINDDQETLTDYTTDINTHLAVISSVRNDILDDQSDLETGQIDVRRAELDVEDTLLEIEDRKIRAPFSGIVTDIEASVGETVSTGSIVVSLISDNSFQIKAQVPEVDIAFINIGDKALISLDAYDEDVLGGEVVSIAPRARIVDGVSVFETTIQFESQDERVRAGLSADIDIIAEEEQDVLSVPSRAVVEDDGVRYVRVIVGPNSFRKTPVVLGFRGEDGNIIVREGISEGDEVMVFTPTGSLDTFIEVE